MCLPCTSALFDCGAGAPYVNAQVAPVTVYHGDEDLAGTGSDSEALWDAQVFAEGGCQRRLRTA